MELPITPRRLKALATLLMIAAAAGVTFAAEADSAKRTSCVRAAARIDALVEAQLAKQRLAPNAAVSDEVFLRRTYLAITGMIPSYHRATSFLDSQDPNKRSALIDRLLQSEGYVNHYSNVWSDTLRVHHKMGLGSYYRDYIKSALRSNKPYDQLVTKLITAEGAIFENGAVGFYLRDRGMPLDHMANLTQVFLGTSIQCAQCHDHPFDKWTQYDFYEMAAFTYGAKTEFPETKDRKTKVVDRLGGDLSDDERSAIAATIGTTLKYSARRAVHNYGVGTELKLPNEYEVGDGDAGEVVSPRPLFGPRINVRNGETRRTAFARWVTSPDNPMFAKVIANRLWKTVMGRGLVEPIDDFSEGTTASNPALLDYLATLMIELDYDMQQFLRVLFNTKAYQRESTRNDIPAGQQYHFSGPMVRRMSAEQVWDSIMALMMKNPLERRGSGRDYDVPCPDFPAWSDQELFDLAKKHPGMTKGGRAFRRWLTDNIEELGQAKFWPQATGQKEKDGRPAGLFVSSQLETPLKPGHFLRQFGQSDRMMIEGAHRDPTIPQVLALLNGPLMDPLVAPNPGKQSTKKQKYRSHLDENIISASEAEEKLNVIFISLLGRNPTVGERRLFQDEMNLGNYAGIVWIFLNSHEFLFVQ